MSYDMTSIQFVRYRPEYFQPMINLHRDERAELANKLGFDIGINTDEEEVDLRDIEHAYLQNGGEFLIGFLDGDVVAMGGFQRLTENSAELRRMRVRKDLQGKGYGGQLLKELERLAFQSGIRTLSFETARARPLTLKFYHKHSYRQTGTGFYSRVETVHFSKALDERIRD